MKFNEKYISQSQLNIDALKQERELEQDLQDLEQLREHPSYNKALKRCKKEFNKHKREIKRLKKVAENALYACNKEQYCYAVGKIRIITKQEVNETILNTMWIDNIRTLEEIRTKYGLS